MKDVGMIVAVVVAAVVTAGAALYAVAAMAGEYMSFAAALGSVITGNLTLAGAIVSGAGGGFGAALSGSLLNGASIGEAFRSGLVGAVIGGITGGLTYGIGSIAEDSAWNWGEIVAVAHAQHQRGPCVRAEPNDAARAGQPVTFLVDARWPPAPARWLAKAGCDARAVREVGLREGDDGAV